jgi:NADH dehydrogenase
MRRHELAGPDTLDHVAVAELVLRAAGRERPLLGVPERLTKASLKTVEALMKSKAPATWDEAELLQVSMTSPHGTADAEALGVRPRSMAAVLGTAG